MLLPLVATCLVAVICFSSTVHLAHGWSVCLSSPLASPKLRGACDNFNITYQKIKLMTGVSCVSFYKREFNSFHVISDLARIFTSKKHTV
jgi:hypothetical protein